MKACKACAVKVHKDSDFCPLCGEPLKGAAEGATYAGEYPDLSSRMRSYSLVRRILLFASLLVCGTCVLINFLVTPQFWWSLIVVATTVYAWISVPPYLRHGVNFAARVVVQVLLTAALAVFLDVLIGWRGWSGSYVLPGLTIAGNATVGLMILFNRTNWRQYVLYQCIMALFGLAPFILYLIGWADNLVLVIVATALAFASLLATIVFGDRRVKDEFRRRLHF